MYVRVHVCAWGGGGCDKVYLIKMKPFKLLLLHFEMMIPHCLEHEKKNHVLHFGLTLYNVRYLAYMTVFQV